MFCGVGMPIAIVRLSSFIVIDTITRSPSHLAIIGGWLIKKNRWIG